MRYFGLASLVLAVFLLACGGSSGNPPVPRSIPVTGVTLSKTELVLQVGEKETLQHSVQPADASNRTVTWSSSNSGVASVSDGLVTAVSGGVAVIMAVALDGSKAAACEVVVPKGSPSFQWAVAGEEGGQAILWTDSATYRLGEGAAKYVVVSNDGLLYVAGEQDGYPVLWLGDKLSKVLLSQQKGRANEVLVHGDDIYIAGTVNDRISYWKNGVLTVSTIQLENPRFFGSKSEGKSIAVFSDGVIYVEGSFWDADLNEYSTSFTPGSFPFTSNLAINSGTTYNKCVVVNDTYLRAGTEYYEYGDIKATLASISSGSRFFGNGRLLPGDFSAFDIVPLDFKDVPTLDNTILLATSLGVYKIGGVPNKAIFDEYGFGGGWGNMFHTVNLLPGYGYCKAVRLLGDSIYAAGKNDNGAVIWKDGSVLRQLSTTGEAYSLLVR